MDLSNPKNIKKNYDLVVIGASWGGLEALTTVLSSLPKNYPLPILVVQHRQRNQIDTEMLVNVMNKRCKLNVLEPDDKEPIEAGNLYIAPSDYHMFVEHKGEIALSSDELVNYSRPSIDLLFESAADCYQSGVLGIILTGANSDGASGLQTIKNKGGGALIQSPETAEVDTMPLAAMAATQADAILPLSEITMYLKELKIN